MSKNQALSVGSKQTANLSLTGVERHLMGDDIIVSKTDPQGKITYVNKIFLDISGYVEGEMLGAPHAVIRHPHMPRAIFKLLWETIGDGREIFAYVVNRCKNGDHYWVMAHVTPSYSLDGKLLGYHSNRRAPKPESLQKVRTIYDQLLQIEKNHDRKQGLEMSSAALQKILKENEVSYEKFILSI